MVTKSLSIHVGNLTAKGVIFIDHIANELFPTLFRMGLAEAYSGPCQVFMTELSAKTVEGLAVHYFCKNKRLHLIY